MVYCYVKYSFSRYWRTFHVTNIEFNLNLFKTAHQAVYIYAYDTI